jgi:hypothetical protein
MKSSEFERTELFQQFSAMCSTKASILDEVMRFDTSVEKPGHRQLLARRPC